MTIHGQEVLKRDGILVGFNAGYKYTPEHEKGYRGIEQMQPKRNRDKNKDNPFNAETIKNPEAVHIMEFEDGKVLLTNNKWHYNSLIEKPEEERLEYLKTLLNIDDINQNNEIQLEVNDNIGSTNVIALWHTGFYGTNGHFDLISTNEQSSELIKTLYNEIQKGNVAISSDYSFMFEDRGLSFVLLDQLTEEDIKNKQLADHYFDISKKLEQDYKQYIQQEGLYGQDSVVEEGKYPVEIWNLQICDVKNDFKRRYNTRILYRDFGYFKSKGRFRFALHAETI